MIYIPATMEDKPLEQYCIYNHPKDYPNHFVVRRWAIGPGTMTPDNEPFMVTVSMEDIHLKLGQEMGLFFIGRFPEDDPCIIGVYL